MTYAALSFSAAFRRPVALAVVSPTDGAGRCIPARADGTRAAGNQNTREAPNSFRVPGVPCPQGATLAGEGVVCTRRSPGVAPNSSPNTRAAPCGRACEADMITQKEP